MSSSMRRQGVYGENLPVKRTLSVAPSDFLIGGVVGQFERAYNKSFLVNNVDEFQEIFGKHVASGNYGWDAVKGFFDNVIGVDAKLYVSSYVGNANGVIDGVVATRSVSDQTNPTLRVDAAYQEELEYGLSGNRTAVKITPATRFTTAAAAGVAATGVSIATLDSVIGIKVGDIVEFTATAGTPGTVYKVITAKDESAKTVSWTGDFEASGASGEALDVDDVVEVQGFTVQTYRKDINGIETEVETELGNTICTMESAVSDFYAPNVHATNRWVKLTDLSSATVLGDREISADSAPVYLLTGAAGGVPGDAADWANSIALLADDPIRLLILPETTDQTINESAETLMAARDDTPYFIAALPESQTKAQLITIGNNYQRSDEVFAVAAANWLKVTDPFSTSSVAPPRNVPNVGHVMGLWIRSIGLNGIHYSPALKSNPMRGVIGVVGDQFLNDRDRTDIAEAGVNLIQDLVGIGVVLRNLFTFSTDTAYKFGNGPLMRNFIKISSVDSLQSSENTPNSLGRIREDANAILTFLYTIWDRGSTGGVPTGESFGRTQDAEGNESQPEDHFQVQADAVNNPQSGINNGERNIDTYFTYPTPAGSIKIGVGILLLA